MSGLSATMLLRQALLVSAQTLQSQTEGSAPEIASVARSLPVFR